MQNGTSSSSTRREGQKGTIPSRNERDWKPADDGGELGTSRTVSDDRSTVIVSLGAKFEDRKETLEAAGEGRDGGGGNEWVRDFESLGDVKEEDSEDE